MQARVKKHVYPLINHTNEIIQATSEKMYKMRKEFQDGFACWEFQGFEKVFTYEEYNALKSQYLNNSFQSRLENLKIILSELTKFNLLRITKITLDKIEYDIESWPIEEITKFIKEKISDRSTKYLNCFYVILKKVTGISHFIDPLLIFSCFDQIYLLLCKEITMFYFFTKSGFTLIEFTYTQSRKRLFTFVIFNEL